MAGVQVPEKPLAQWRTWWSGTDWPHKIATRLHSTIDPTKMPGSGQVVELHVKGKVTQADLCDDHTGKVVEGLLESYPPNKDPSGYLLGDACLCLNAMMGHSIFGPAKPNPIDEKYRRDAALKQGTMMKMLLAYVRASSGRTPQGRSATVTYLKELALSKGRPGRKKSRGSKSPSSSCSTMSAATLELGECTSKHRSRCSSTTETLG